MAKNNNNLILALLGISVAVYFFTKKPVDKKQKLVEWINSSGDSQDSKSRLTAIVYQMPPNEIDAFYEFVFSYLLKGKSVPENSALRAQIDFIGKKYNIFT